MYLTFAINTTQNSALLYLWSIDMRVVVENLRYITIWQKQAVNSAGEMLQCKT